MTVNMTAVAITAIICVSLVLIAYIGRKAKK